MNEWGMFQMIAEIMENNLDWKAICLNIANITKTTFLQNRATQMQHQGNLGWLSLDNRHGTL